MKTFAFATLCVFACLMQTSLTYDCKDVNPFWDITIFPNAIDLTAESPADSNFDASTRVYNLTGAAADLCPDLKGQSCCSSKYLEKSKSTLEDLVKLISETSKDNYESRINKLAEAEKNLGKGVDAMYNLYTKFTSVAMKVISSGIKVFQDGMKDKSYAESIQKKVEPLQPAITLLQESMIAFVDPKNTESKTVKYYSERILKNARTCIDVAADILGLSKSDLHYINNALPHLYAISSTGDSFGALKEFVNSRNTSLNENILLAINDFGNRQLLVPIPDEFKALLSLLAQAFPDYAAQINQVLALNVIPIPALADGKNIDAISLALYNIVKDSRTTSEAIIALNNASVETFTKTVNDTGVWERKSYWDVQFGGSQPNMKKLLNKVYAFFFRSVVNTTVQASDVEAKNNCLDIVLQYHAFVRCSACRVDSNEAYFKGNKADGLTAFYSPVFKNDVAHHCGAYIERLAAANSSIQLIQGINGLGNVTSDTDYVINPNAIYGQQPNIPLDSQTINPVSLAGLLGYNSSDINLPNSWFTDVLVTPFGMNLSTVLFQENEHLVVLNPIDTIPFNQQEGTTPVVLSSKVEYSETAPMVSLDSTGFKARLDYTIDRKSADALIAAEDPVITTFGWRASASFMLAFTAVIALLF